MAEFFFIQILGAGFGAVIVLLCYFDTTPTAGRY